MQIRLTNNSLDWFESKNISFHNRFGTRLKIGDVINFIDDLEVEPYIGIHEGNTICSMGFMSYTNSPVPEDLKIGRYCSLAPGLKFPRYRHPVEHISTSIFTHDRSTDLVVRFMRDSKTNYKNFYPNFQAGHITIAHDVWIGQDVSILPGLTIGTGSIVAAGSVVTKSVAPYEIVGGNPAKRIRMRFEPGLNARLMLSRWWDHKFTDFAQLNLSDPETFLSQFEQIRSRLDVFSPKKIKLKDVIKHADRTK